MAKTSAALDVNGKPKFGIRDKLAYAAGDLGCNMSFSLKSTVQTFWLVFMTLETGLLSILLLLVQIWDAVNDPLLGTLIDHDRRNYRHGKFKTYIFIGACGLLFGGAAVFLPFPGAPTVVKAILFILGYVIWDAFYTVANVPYGSMLSLVTNDVGERAQLSTWRSIGSMIGNMLPMVLLPMLIWEKAVWDGTTDFLNKIEIPREFTKEQFLMNPETGTAYQIGEKILSPVTGKQVEVLRGDVVFWAALIMGILGFLCFLFMLKNITIRVDENTVKTSEGGSKGQHLLRIRQVHEEPACCGLHPGCHGPVPGHECCFHRKYHHVRHLFQHGFSVRRCADDRFPAHAPVYALYHKNRQKVRQEGSLGVRHRRLSGWQRDHVPVPPL